MNIKTVIRHFSAAAVIAVSLAGLTACEDSKSYAERLEDENKAVNLYLANHHVVPYVPADTVFEVGEDAPYYCLDNNKGVYMQVISMGDGQMADSAQTVYFRFERFALTLYTGSDDNMDSLDWSGNANDLITDAMSFKFMDYTNYNSVTYGTGIQQPLRFVPLNSYVRLIVKSQFGWSSEESYVTPFLYKIRYFKDQW